MKKYILIMVLALGQTAFGQSNGTDVFDESYVHEIKLTFNQVDFWDSLEFYYSDFLDNGAPKRYMLASAEIDGNMIDSVGVRQKGFYSNWGSDGLKEPLKINFKTYSNDQRYDGLKKINLQNGFKDPTMMRDAVAYKIMRDAGIPAPRTSFAKVYLNNTYWGLYIIVEQVDSRFLKNWYDDNDGNLFKCMDNTSLDWQGASPTAYQDEFELKTNEPANDWSGFIDLVDKINNENEFADSISSRLNILGYLKVLAADVLMYNWDSYYEHGRNFYVYEDSASKIFQWIPWDYNLAFSDQPTDIVITYGGSPFPGGSGAKPLVVNVMDNDVLRSHYFNELCLLLDDVFNLDHLEGYIDAQKALIQTPYDDDPNKFYTMANFNAGFNSDVQIQDQFGFNETIKGLKPFISGRYQTVQNQFSTHNHSCSALSIEEETFSQNAVFPNPTLGVFNLSLAADVDMIQIFDIHGSLVFSTQNVVDKMTIDFNDQSSGLYIVKLHSNQGFESLKLIVED